MSGARTEAADGLEAIPVIPLEPMPPAWAVRLGCLRIAADLRTGNTTPFALIETAGRLERWVTGQPAKEEA